MLSERVQRQIDRLLDEAERAMAERNWAAVRENALDALALDPDNADAKSFLAAADQRLGYTAPPGEAPDAVGAQRAVPSAPQAPVLPTSFANGRYTVRRFLGEGGKKKVYLAHDSLLDRDVAFALIKTEGLDEAARERITREAQAMGRLGDHPHIATIYDFGIEPSPSAYDGEPAAGQPYMVLPLLPGGDVADLIEKTENHQLPFEQAVRIADQVCQALEHAHRRGVLHRDVKPGNVVLSEDGTAKLADFGLAVAIDRSRLTQAGMMVGTVSYMPPEQALGGEITAKSDLYSTGCMLYEMVTGRPPFVGDDNIAIIGQHLNTPPVSPSWHRPDLPKGLEALILRLLEKDPNRRPASAAEVRQALASIDLRPDAVGAIHELPLQQTTDNPLYRRTFVGREAELRQLQSAFDAAISGQGSLAMVVGEPGIGKTALVEQLATYVSLRGGRTLVGHSYEEGSLSLPYLAFVETMRSYVVAREPDALKSDLGTGAADVARIVSEIRDRVQVELRPLGDPEDDRWRLFQSVTSFLRNAATVQPLLIVVEDLHWADRGTLDLMLHIARNLQGARLTIVGTYRDVEVDRTHPLSSALAELSRVTNLTRIRLRGLTVDEVQRMMNNIRGQEVTWSRAEAIHRQTEGNPLFVQEVLRYLVEEGLVVREGGRYARTDAGGPPEAGIPEGLRDVIGKRLSHLSPETNRLLSIAAVIGREFRLETLQAIASLDEEQLIGSLDEAVKVGVLEERSQVGGVHYRFAHAFFRQTLYEELSAPRRLRLHQDVARALEAQYAGRKQEHAAELAEHFANSTDRADLAKAVEYGELAAQRAMAVFDYGEAVRLLERALDVQEVLDPDDKAKRCDLLVALGEALGPAGNPLRAYEVVAEEAFGLAETLSDQRRASRACWIALDGLNRYGAATMRRTPIYRQWAERADRNAAPGTVERVRADVAVARVLATQDRHAEAWRIKIRALEAARKLHDPELLFSTASSFLGTPRSPRQEAEVLRLAEEFAAAPRGGVAARTLGGVLFFAGALLLQYGERSRAEELFAQMKELATRTQDAQLVLNPIIAEIRVATLDGELEAAVTASERLVARAEELGAPVLGRQFASNANYALVCLGRGEKVLARVVDAREMSGAEASVTEQLLTARTIAQVGRSAEAGHLLRRVIADLNMGSEDDGTFTLTLLNVLETAVLLGEAGPLPALVSRLEPVRSFSWSVSPACPARLLGAASALLGKPAEAQAYYQQALEACAKIRFRPEIALTRLQLAELLLEHYPHERAEALEHLDFAISEFREMKMQPSLERALRHRGLLRA
ncbi:MAG TPA: protein kinase [Dehalococcoidia bacterium]|nr:protein kinase [Dehalococcoidia bacterium]